MCVFQGCGAAFFPEHHARETWDEYVDLMGDAGIQFVRMGEFAWDKLEPREGRFDFAWLDHVFSLLDRRHIKVLLCTPTAVPPIWACERYPDLHPVQRDGRTFGFGVRRYTCPTSDSYHRLCEGIAAALADHYGRSEQVLGWQIDNEFGHPFCFCPRCLREFQAWCEKRFGTVDRFNDALVTHFLGQTLERFDQIPFPTTYPHPSLWISYHRFFSDATIDCFARQVRCLKAHGVRQPVTSNMMPTWYGYDHEAMAGHFDVVAGDHYFLGNIFGTDFAGEAFVSAYLRGMKDGAGIWLHEMQCAATGGGLPLPGQVRWSALTQVGLGANLINYFRWDTCPSGMERDSLGLLKPCRQPGRIFAEVRQTAAELQAAKPALDGTAPARAEIAILYTYENHWEFAENPKSDEFKGPSGNGYGLHLSKHFRAIAGQNYAVDIIYPGADFSRYSLILAPALYILPEPLGRKLATYVEAGGRLLLTSFCGIADENAKMWDKPAPAPISAVAGVRVLDYGRYHEAMGDLRIAFRDAAFPIPPLNVRTWVDEVLPDGGTEVLAAYEGGGLIHAAAFTRKQSGRGSAYYLGTILEKDDYRVFYGTFLRALGLKPVMDLPDRVHVSLRTGDGRRLFFISNDSAEPRDVALPIACKEAATGRPVARTLRLAPFDVAMLTDA